MFDLTLRVATILLTVIVIFGILKLFDVLKSYIATLRNHWIGVDTNDFVERATERVLRIVEEEFGKKHDVQEAKKMTFAEGMLNDVLREAGFDVMKFNIKGLLQAKKQEKGL